MYLLEELWMTVYYCDFIDFVKNYILVGKLI